jgi:hypothetical protein
VFICASCVADFVRHLIDLEHAPVELFADLDRDPCSFCNRRELSSAVRFRRSKGVICAPCVALTTAVFNEPPDVESPRLPAGLAAELRDGARDLAQQYPDLALVLAPPPGIESDPPS